VARVLLIANPVAARHDEAVRHQVVDYLGREGWQVEMAVTTGPGDARELAAQGGGAGGDAVAVFGGDGTSTQAAAALVGTGVPLALIPGGTGNLLAGNLRIPGNPVRAARSLVKGKRLAIDLGRVVLPDGEHYFGVACGAGVDAAVMGDTATANKRRWGIGAYFASTFRVLPSIRSSVCSITVDDACFDFPAAIVLIMNCGEMIPPVVRIRPEINPEDGILDLVAISADTPWQGIRGLLRVVFDGRREAIRETHYVRYARGTRFTVAPAEQMPMQFDGDTIGQTPFTAEVCPKALLVMVPNG
jgi:YegS/Rv2252/BmrU family lipid kinase